MHKLAYLDMDGVLVDFIKGALTAHDRLDLYDNYPVGVWNIWEPMGITGEEFWAPLKSYDFWINLEPYPWFDELLTMMNDYFGNHWWIATSTGTVSMSASAKLDWIFKHFPKNDGKKFTRFNLCPDKEHLGINRPDSVLIDDYIVNHTKYLATGAHSILFAQPWNNKHHVNDKLNDLESEIKRFIA